MVGSVVSALLVILYIPTRFVPRAMRTNRHYEHCLWSSNRAEISSLSIKEKGRPRSFDGTLGWNPAKVLDLYIYVGKVTVVE